MKTFECTKCKSKNIFVDEAGNYTGLYCYDCGNWIKWLNKSEAKAARKQEKANRES